MKTFLYIIIAYKTQKAMEKIGMMHHIGTFNILELESILRNKNFQGMTPLTVLKSVSPPCVLALHNSTLDGEGRKVELFRLSAFSALRPILRPTTLLQDGGGGCFHTLKILVKIKINGKMNK